MFAFNETTSTPLNWIVHPKIENNDRIIKFFGELFLNVRGFDCEDSKITLLMMFIDMWLYFLWICSALMCQYSTSKSTISYSCFLFDCHNILPCYIITNCNILELPNHFQLAQFFSESRMFFLHLFIRQMF